MLSKASIIALKTLLLTNKTLYLGLYSGKPDKWGAGKEVTYSGYERQLIEFNVPMNEGATGNSNTVQIPRPPEGFTAESITHCGIFDAKTGGNLVLFGVLRADGKPQPYPLSHNATFNIGANGVQFDLVNVEDVSGCNG